MNKIFHDITVRVLKNPLQKENFFYHKLASCDKRLFKKSYHKFDGIRNMENKKILQDANESQDLI